MKGSLLDQDLRDKEFIIGIFVIKGSSLYRILEFVMPRLTLYLSDRFLRPVSIRFSFLKLYVSQ